jgi:hypothetical protein
VDLSAFVKYSNIFIETGSCEGDGIQRAIDAGFSDIRSVELYQKNFEYCRQRFRDEPKVSLYFGNSIEHLGRMLPPFPCVIFLDAHPSGPRSAGHSDLLKKGDDSEFAQHNMIRKELAIILNHRKDHVIIIDDVNGMNERTAEYIEIIKTANPGYNFRICDQELPGVFYPEKILVCTPTG